MSANDSLEDLAAAWRDRIDEQADAQDALEVELDETDLAAYGLAMMEQAVDKELDSIGRKVTRKGAALTAELAALRRQLGVLDGERRRYAEEAQARIASLEAEGETLRAGLAEAVKEIAGLRYELARDRAHRAMLEQRKFDIPGTVAIEQARRRTCAAIGTG